jgi:hypothetical protein
MMSRGIGWLEAAGLGAGGAPGEAPGEGAALKYCVKLPSPDAESDDPGDEKPFARPAPGGAEGVGRGGSSTFAGGAEAIALLPLTKMRVNSPGAGWLDGAGADAPGGGAWRSGVAGALSAGRDPRVCRNWVNSPGVEDGGSDFGIPEVRSAAEKAGGSGRGSPIASAPAFPWALAGELPGVFGVSGVLSKARRNIPVALSASESSGISLPDFSSIFAIGSAPLTRANAHCEAYTRAHEA